MSDRDRFREAVIEGLSSSPKVLPSRYFYDPEGDRLFQQIMELPGYYLSRAERDNMPAVAEGIRDWMRQTALDVVDLGSGDGRKTEILLEGLLGAQSDLRYFPVDISPSVLELQSQRLLERWPDLILQPVAADYLRSPWVLPEAPGKRLFLFLGSNLGNFTGEAEEALFALLRRLCRPGDGVLLGLDLAKRPERILAAYNDPEGVTARFNLNLLDRINRELGGDFDRSAFVHWPIYDPIALEARSHLVCVRQAEFGLSGGPRFSFEAFEAIHTETSRKYSLAQTERKAGRMGFLQTRSFVHRDAEGEAIFADLLWERPTREYQS
ncbi:L-histidine N(alpha)-methyltransferase [bacterium]|nr:L-histidine N(alpha)-methyltransferase [bacterium]